ncbi:hypothetical protein GOV08_02115 [Candidatus Woesearchaeota archaeon]|nr:hypothetical protein [Candidatus Woesearchaeota archaeon]
MVVGTSGDIFFELGIIIIIATMGGYLARLLRQPLIPAYILVGVILGPVLNLITNQEVVLTMSEIGISFLLFTVGLELDLKKLRDIGSIATLGGLLQFIFLFSTGFLVASVLGYIPLEAVYMALVLVFSSTMVVIKLLSDKRELDTLHGRILIGLLLMQDILAILAISVLSTINNLSALTLLAAVLKGASLFVIATLAAKLVFPRIFKFAAKSQELLFLLAVSVSFAFSLLFTLFDFSIAIGAFIAGVSLANLPYNIEIVSRVRPLKDFFSTVFFVSLGLQIVLSTFSKIVVPLIVFLIFTIFFKTLLNIVIVAVFGYEKRTSFITAISLANISEFGLIIVMAGRTMGHISEEFLSLVIILTTITIITSTYFIKFNKGFYKTLKPFIAMLGPFRTNVHQLHYIQKEEPHEVIMIGYDRIGYNIYQTLSKINEDVLIVDFNPDIIKRLIKKQIPCIYGDIGDIEILERLDLKSVNTVISTIPEIQENLLLIKKVKEHNKDAMIFVTAYQVEEALELYDEGADYVILPHFLGGEHVSLLLEDVSKDVNKLLDTKMQHIRELNLRKELHPHHT